MLILNKTSFWKNFSIIQYVSTHLKLGLICFFNFMKSHLFDHMKQVHQYFFMINKKLTWYLFVNWYVIFIAFSKIFIKYSTGRNFDKKIQCLFRKEESTYYNFENIHQSQNGLGWRQPVFSLDEVQTSLKFSLMFFYISILMLKCSQMWISKVYIHFSLRSLKCYFSLSCQYH